MGKKTNPALFYGVFHVLDESVYNISIYPDSKIYVKVEQP